MKQFVLSIFISVLAVFFAGCGNRCFYQEGKGIEQCENDLLDCLYSNRPTRMCMQAKGYQYLDADKLPLDRKRKKVAVLLEESKAYGGREATSKEYWVADGLSMASDYRRLISRRKPQGILPNAPSRKLIGYRARQDDFGKFTITPVFEDEQKK